MGGKWAKMTWRPAQWDTDYSPSTTDTVGLDGGDAGGAVQVNLSHINVLLIFENHNSNYHPFTVLVVLDGAGGSACYYLTPYPFCFSRIWLVQGWSVNLARELDLALQ